MKPLPACAASLPSTNHLCESPQLAVLATLQSNLRLAAQVLDIQHPELGSLPDIFPDPDADSLLAQLIIDRCRELSELVLCYRLALHPHSEYQVDPDLPF